MLAEIEGLIGSYVHQHHLLWHFESVHSKQMLRNRLHTQSYATDSLQMSMLSPEQKQLQPYQIYPAPQELEGELQDYTTSLARFVRSCCATSLNLKNYWQFLLFSYGRKTYDTTSLDLKNPLTVANPA